MNYSLSINAGPPKTWSLEVTKPDKTVVAVVSAHAALLKQRALIELCKTALGGESFNYENDVADITYKLANVDKFK